MSKLSPREIFYNTARNGREFPVCNLCGVDVLRNQDWVKSHDPAKPKALGGKKMGVAHFKCNATHGAVEVTPMVAKAKRQRRDDRFITGPGLGKYPMRCGRRSGSSKTIRHGVVPRLTQGQKLAATLSRRAIIAPEPAS